jgi:hypothetical protein
MNDYLPTFASSAPPRAIDDSLAALVHEDRCGIVADVQMPLPMLLDDVVGTHDLSSLRERLAAERSRGAALRAM